MEFLQRTPFFRLLLPFVSGIILYQYIQVVDWLLYSLLGLSILLIVISFFIKVPKNQFNLRWIFGVGIFGFLFIVSSVLCRWNDVNDAFSHLHKKGIYQVQLTSAPIAKANSIQCKVAVLKCFDKDKWLPAKGKAILYFQKDNAASALLFGDKLMVNAEFTSPPNAQNPSGFDYAAYLHRQGIAGTSYISSGSWTKIETDLSFSIFREADKWRNYLLNIYRSFSIKADEFAVLAALTLGYTDDLQPDLRQSYSATGAMHILSVSGMHVGVVYVVMAFLLSFLDKNQRLKVFKTILIALFLWGYAFLTGLSPAVIRATLMFTFVAIATCFERKSLMYNTIFMSILFMLLVNPNYLFDVGFQLSYAAVLSIVFFQPAVSRFYNPQTKITSFLWSLFSVSIAAQLGTTPITLYYFQQFPNYFLLTNLVAIPLSTVVIYLAIALLLVSPIPYVSSFIAAALNGSLWLLNYCIVWIQQLPYSISPLSLNLWQVSFLFTAIFCFSLYFYTKKFAPLFLGLVTVLFACVLNLRTNYDTFTSNKLIVYAGQKATQVNFIYHNQNFVSTTNPIETEKIAKMYWRVNKLSEPQLLSENSWFSDGFVYFKGIRALILNKELLNVKTVSTPLELDYLIVGNALKPKIAQLLENFHPRHIIVDKSISTWYTEQIRKECQQRNIAFYSVAEKGAFVLNNSENFHFISK